MNVMPTTSQLISLLLFVVGCVHVQSSLPQVVIREYQKERDEAAVIAILNQCPQFLRYETAGLPAGTTEQYINSSKYTTHVLQEDDKTVGFVNFIKIDKKILFLNFGCYGMIHLMGVDESHQGKQYGKYLLSDAIRSLLNEGVSQMVLTAKLNNERARRLYEKSGFKLFACLGEDCIYSVNFINEKAPQPTREQKILEYALQNPRKSALVLAALVAGGGYLGYKAARALIHKLH